MSVPASSVPCDVCKGTGLVPHEKRKIYQDIPDAADFQTEEICSKCGGTGRMKEPLPPGPSEPA